MGTGPQRNEEYLVRTLKQLLRTVCLPMPSTCKLWEMKFHESRAWWCTVLLSGSGSLCVIGPLVPDDIGRFYPLSTGFGSVPDLLACVAALAATSVRCSFWFASRFSTGCAACKVAGYFIQVTLVQAFVLLFGKTSCVLLVPNSLPHSKCKKEKLHCPSFKSRFTVFPHQRHRQSDLVAIVE